MEGHRETHVEMKLRRQFSAELEREWMQNVSQYVFGKITLGDYEAVLRLKCGNSWLLELLWFSTKKPIQAAAIRHALMLTDACRR